MKEETIICDICMNTKAKLKCVICDKDLCNHSICRKFLSYKLDAKTGSYGVQSPSVQVFDEELVVCINCHNKMAGRKNWKDLCETARTAIIRQLKIDLMLESNGR